MEKFQKFSLSILKLLLFILYAPILTFLIESFSRGGIPIAYEYLKESFNTFIYNSSVVLLTLTPLLIFKKHIFYITLASLFWIILGIANFTLLTLRGTPLTGSDFGMIKNGIELIPKYLSFNSIIMALITVIGLIVAFIIFYMKIPKKKINYYITIPLILIYIFFFPNITNYVTSKNIISGNFWDIVWQYSSYGFPYSFLYSVCNSGISKPDNYSEENMNLVNNTLENISIDNNSGSKYVMSSDYIPTNVDYYIDQSNTPNIIIVQLESFLDPLWIEDIEYTEDPIPNFRNLSNNYSSGILNVPTIGGGTANTEFEVITGMSMDFFAAGEYPYNTLVSKKSIPSFAYYFQDLDYDTHALHNYDGTYYTRYKVYRNLGFHTFTSIENMDLYETTPFQWPKDNVLISQVESALNSSDSSDFIFAVSVQGHGGYADYYIADFKIRSSSTSSDYNLNNIDYYINQIHEVDTFIGDLITMIESLNEPTIVAFYGDHIPSLGLNSEKLIPASLTATPYVIWDNIGLSKEDKDLEAYELSADILTKLNYPSTPLTNLYNSALDTNTKREYLNLLEYDLLYGKSYTNINLREITPRDDFRIGINYVTIDAIEYLNDNILIKGDNFNNYSKVYINDCAIDTTCVDKNTLSIENYKLNADDIITVKQISATRSKVFSTSNEFIVTN
ncbi:MAG: sulfatase-like hydrolase/transferase [Turicibacter sp.]|nr:sulfatase-like hydrolase/transferase [Turicibacter sp.]